MLLQQFFRNRRRKNQGIVMSAIGEQYVLETVAAARSIKSHMDVEIDITTDSHGARYLSNLQASPFDKIITIKRYKEYEISKDTNRFAKILALCRSRFERTIFVDSDILMMAPISDMFEALEYWDVLGCHAPGRTIAPDGNYLSSYKRSHSKIAKRSMDLVNIFPELNGGVIGISGTRLAKRFARRWLELYYAQYRYFSQNTNEKRYRGDQGSLRLSLLEIRPKLHVMPPEYNVRVIFPYFVGGKKLARILHGRGEAMRVAERSINQSLGIRVGLPNTGILEWTKPPVK